MTKGTLYGLRWKRKYPRKSKWYEKQFKFRKRLFFWDLKNKKCADCKIKYHPVSMDFDHRPGTKKLTRYSGFVAMGRKRILKEIKKCDLVCANCHRIRSYLRACDNRYVLTLFNQYRKP